VNDGHFRALEVVARPGSMFNPVPPSPCNLGHFGGLQAIEVVCEALAGAMPDAVPASSGGDLCPIVWWGVRDGTGEPWADGSPHPVGQGAHVRGDGANALMHVSEAATRFSPVEVWETRNPWLLEKVELAPDSGGAGRHRGGLGLDMHFGMLEDARATSIVERSKNPPWGLADGGRGRANGASIRFADGSRKHFAKATRLSVPRGATLELATGGGGGYGPAHERAADAILADLREGYITEAHARAHYPHAFGDA
jgi:N-methylhydantoinase B